MKNVDRYKAIYELWVTYLKKSQRYKDLCETYRDYGHSTVFGSKRQQKRRFNRGNWVLRDIYDFFGDIHGPEYSFDEWWNNIMLPFLRKYLGAARTIAKLDNKIHQHAAEVKEELSSLIRQGDDAITIEKIEDLLNNFFWSKAVVGLLSQIQTHCTPETLEAKLTTVMNDEREQVTMTKPTSLIIPLLTPNRLLKEEDIQALKRYLTIYEYRNQNPKIKYEQIAAMLANDEDREWDGSIVQHKRPGYVTDNAHAEQIVKNTERGLFPGVYHKKRLKKKKQHL